MIFFYRYVSFLIIIHFLWLYYYYFRSKSAQSRPICLSFCFVVLSLIFWQIVKISWDDTFGHWLGCCSGFGTNANSTRNLEQKPQHTIVIRLRSADVAADVAATLSVPTDKRDPITLRHRHLGSRFSAYYDAFLYVDNMYGIICTLF